MKEIDKESTFTFIVEFRGGTYCTQVKARNVNESINKWILKIKDEQTEIKHLGDKIIAELEKDLSEANNQPVLLKGLENTWCTSASTINGSFLINIVKTNTT